MVGLASLFFVFSSSEDILDFITTTTEEESETETRLLISLLRNITRFVYCLPSLRFSSFAGEVS